MLTNTHELSNKHSNPDFAKLLLCDSAFLTLIVMYQIMNKELTGYSLSGYECLRYYERDKEAHLNPKDSRYGDVLVKMKRVKSGFEFKLKISWRFFDWKPRLSWKYNKYFHWLFFMFWFEFTFSDIVDSVISDHLTETLK